MLKYSQSNARKILTPGFCAILRHYYVGRNTKVILRAENVSWSPSFLFWGIEGSSCQASRTSGMFIVLPNALVIT